MILALFTNKKRYLFESNYFIEADMLILSRLQSVVNINMLQISKVFSVTFISTLLKLYFQRELIYLMI